MAVQLGLVRAGGESPHLHQPPVFVLDLGWVLGWRQLPGQRVPSHGPTEVSRLAMARWFTIYPHSATKKEKHVSFQAYLDNIEEKTGLRPRQFIELAHKKGLDDPAVKTGVIVDWLKEDYGLGRGHAMALVHVIKKGRQIDAKHVDSGGTHSDPSDMLWLDGKATNPQ